MQSINAPFIQMQKVSNIYIVVYIVFIFWETSKIYEVD